MIEGVFRDGWPTVSLSVIGETGQLTVDFTVDTGFGGALALPSGLLQQIGASYTGSDEYRLADGTPRRFGFALVEIADMETIDGEENRFFTVLSKEGPSFGS